MELRKPQPQPTANRLTPEQEFGDVNDTPLPRQDVSGTAIATPIPERKSSNSSFKYDPTDAPTPGESLTGEPGNAMWERPPQFTDPQKAAAYVWQQLNKPAKMKQMLTLMDQGVPVEALARMVIFAGFNEGKWTPDMAMLMGKPVTMMIATLGHMADLAEMKISMKDRNTDQNVTNLVMQKYKSDPNSYKNAYMKMQGQKASAMPQEVKDAKSLVRGLMSRKAGE